MMVVKTLGTALAAEYSYSLSPTVHRLTGWFMLQMSLFSTLDWWVDDQWPCCRGSLISMRPKLGLLTRRSSIVYATSPETLGRR